MRKQAIEAYQEQAHNTNQKARLRGPSLITVNWSDVSPSAPP